jgi:hypothetical protein
MKRDEINEKLSNALLDYVLRVCSADYDKSPGEIETLPEIVEVLIKLLDAPSRELRQGMNNEYREFMDKAIINSITEFNKAIENGDITYNDICGTLELLSNSNNKDN